MSTINNKRNIEQIIDFTNLQFGKMAPSDDDGFMEISGKIFIHFEIKHVNGNCEGAQRKAFEKRNDLIEKAGPVTFTIIAKHNQEITDIIDAGKCMVYEYRRNSVWNKPIEQINLHDFIEGIIKRHCPERLNYPQPR